MAEAKTKNKRALEAMKLDKAGGPRSVTRSDGPIEAQGESVTRINQPEQTPIDPKTKNKRALEALKLQKATED